MTRREIIQAAGVGGLGPLCASTVSAAPFSLPKLPYAFDALEPHIDARTMEIHHDRHHQAYVDNLNKAVGSDAKLAALTVEELLRRLDALPESIRTNVRNNGGGHLNHSLLWQTLAKASDRSPKESSHRQ